jgi:hypothetical protein
MYRSVNTPRTNAASFSKPGGQLAWLCPDLIAHLYVEGQNKLGDHYNLGLRLWDTPAQSALACEYELAPGNARAGLMPCWLLAAFVPSVLGLAYSSTLLASTRYACAWVEYQLVRWLLAIVSAAVQCCRRARFQEACRGGPQGAPSAHNGILVHAAAYATDPMLLQTSVISGGMQKMS